MASRLLQLSERTLKLAPVVARIPADGSLPRAGAHWQARGGWLRHELVNMCTSISPSSPCRPSATRSPQPRLRSCVRRRRVTGRTCPSRRRKPCTGSASAKRYAEIVRPSTSNVVGKSPIRLSGSFLYLPFGATLWVWIFLKKFVYGPLPESCSPEAKEAQLKRMIDLRVNPIDGVASKWDYENNRWK
uniref:Cytochrome c oxidase subunit 4 n=1 Tax=Ixodes ricinus TaxID=34613 RepID=V5HGC5_IXORI